MSPGDSLQCWGAPSRTCIGQPQQGNWPPLCLSHQGSSNPRILSLARGIHSGPCFQRDCLRWPLLNSSVSNMSSLPAECGQHVEVFFRDCAGTGSALRLAVPLSHASWAQQSACSLKHSQQLLAQAHGVSSGRRESSQEQFWKIEITNVLPLPGNTPGVISVPHSVMETLHFLNHRLLLK